MGRLLTKSISSVYSSTQFRRKGRSWLLARSTPIPRAMVFTLFAAATCTDRTISSVEAAPQRQNSADYPLLGE
jgi:hypothetical protein